MPTIGYNCEKDGLIVCDTTIEKRQKIENIECMAKIRGKKEVMIVKNRTGNFSLV